MAILKEFRAMAGEKGRRPHHPQDPIKYKYEKKYKYEYTYECKYKCEYEYTYKYKCKYESTYN